MIAAHLATKNRSRVQRSLEIRFAPDKFSAIKLVVRYAALHFLVGSDFAALKGGIR